MSDIDPKKMKVAELRDALKERGLDAKGNKAQLVKRLEKAIAKEAGDQGEADQSMDTSAMEDSTAQDDSLLDSSQDEGGEEPKEEAKPEPEETKPEPEAAQPEPEVAQSVPEVKEEAKPEPTQEEDEKPEAEIKQEETKMDETENNDVKEEIKEENSESKTNEGEVAMEAEGDNKTEAEADVKPETEVTQETTDNNTAQESENTDKETISQEPEAQQSEQAEADAEETGEQDGEFHVMDAVGGDTEAPEADQKMEEDKREEARRGDKRKRSRSRERSKRHRSRSRSGSRSRSKSRRSRSPRKRSRSKSQDRHHRRRRSRSWSPRNKAPEVEENEDWISATNVLIDKYNSDLNLRIDESGYKANPITVEGFGFMWAGARANYGVASGKVAFEVKILENLNVNHLPEEETSKHVLRTGYSLDTCSTQLGEEPFSYGYGGTGKASVDCKFNDFGQTFGEGDVITSYVDFENDPVTIAYSKNGEDLGTCFEIEKSTLEEKALFPHVLTKNCEFEVNFGQREEPFFPLKEGFTFINDVPEAERVRGALPPAKKEDCEMIMMCGLPGAGKTYWSRKHATENADKRYNILGTNTIIDKMKVMGLPRKRNYAGRWDVLIDKSTKCLNRLFEIAAKKKRNYILDQTNVYPTAQRRKMRPFEGFQRKAVVIIPTDEVFKQRCEQREKEEGKEVPDIAILEMKEQFQIPEEGPLFDKVEFTELEREEATKLVEQYNKEGRAAVPDHPRRWNRDRGGDRYGGGRDYRGGRDFRGGRGGRGGGYRDNYRDRRGDRGHDRRGSGGYMGYHDRDRSRDRQSRWSGSSNSSWGNKGSSSGSWGNQGGSWGNQQQGNWGNRGWGNQNWNQGNWGNQGSWGNQGNWGNQWNNYSGQQGSNQNWNQGYNYNWNNNQWQQNYQGQQNNSSSYGSGSYYNQSGSGSHSK